MKSICQICHIVRSVRESDLWSVRPWESEVRGRIERPYGRPWESDRPLTHSGRCSLILGPVAPLPAEAMHLAEDRTASPAVRERPIGLSRPLNSASHFGLSHRSHDFVRPILESLCHIANLQSICALRVSNLCYCKLGSSVAACSRNLVIFAARRRGHYL